MLEPDKDEKRGENDEENRLPANLQRFKQKLNLWPVPLKSPGSKFKEVGRWFCNMMSNIYYIDVARLEFPWFGAIIEQKKWLENGRTELIFYSDLQHISNGSNLAKCVCFVNSPINLKNKISRVLTIVEKYNLTKMLEIHQNLRKLRKNVISKKSSVLKGLFGLNWSFPLNE